MSSARSTSFHRVNHSYTRSHDVFVKAILFTCARASRALAIPLTEYHGLVRKNQLNGEKLDFWFNIVIAAVLVLLGGAFAGLTIALMGQDGVYLQVIATSGEGTQQRHAESVYKLLQKGKHWVLVTLLLSNVIVNETLPIVLDRSLGGGWPAVLGSTVLIVIFGEVIPQSICVRYGLSIGAYMAPCVLGLMWILAPIAWPIAKLLDSLLGKDHGTVYKKSGLKTLVTLHKTLGASPTERLNQDEVTIISAVLDLKDKAVGDIMTPIEDVFTMSEDTILNEETMNTILSAGYSRIPIYEPGNPNNFVGMLLVKILITYDPEDCKKVSEFALATLPETRPETSCLDIVNFFQEGKSHMVLVSEFPAENYGAIGVVTLEDVIEELIGEEIIDESDVYIDVHKAIRRLAPAPKANALRRHVVSNSNPVSTKKPEDDLIDLTEDKKNKLASDLPDIPAIIETPLVASYAEINPKITFIRKGSGGLEGAGPITVRGNSSDMREHLKHLGPSNLASRPKSTRYTTVKIKSAHLQLRSSSYAGLGSQPEEFLGDVSHVAIIEEPLSLASQSNNNSKSGHKDQESSKSLSKEEIGNSSVQAVQKGYGSFDTYRLQQPEKPTINNCPLEDVPPKTIDECSKSPPSPANLERVRNLSRRSFDKIVSSKSIGSSATDVRGLSETIVQSGSIDENIIEANRIRNIVLEINGSGEEIEQKEENCDEIPTTIATQPTKDTLKDLQKKFVEPKDSSQPEAACDQSQKPSEVSTNQSSKKSDGGKRRKRKNNGKRKV
ncbi:hemolysin [Golovinomyces cichoracearum]|uniref:Hemolysin n=1 Tax=Golovinomyces cichoracearum TaxID=62708 RepID=A0A420J4V9_9PEZI|nr:hemolysin [Golovinomyces cichoracearum]